MKTLLLLLVVVLLTGCQSLAPSSPAVVWAGGNGSSCEQAVVIRNARFREAGVLAERAWLDRNYPGHHDTKQSALDSAGKHYDLVELTLADGRGATVYFDTTECSAR